MKRLTRQMQSRLAIVVFPYEPQLEQLDRMHDTEYVSKPQRRLTALCQKYEVPCLDLLPAFHEKGRAVKLFRDGIHLTEEGHQFTAAQIYIFLHEKNLLPPVRPEQHLVSELH